jgi:uncharacterized membrane protein
MTSWWIGYGAALVVLGVLDGLWLGWLAIDFYRREIGDLMAPQVRIVPAAMFYFLYPAGLVTLALQPMPEALVTALWRSALVGLVAYGVFDLTNLAVLRHWSVKLAVVDIAWGTFATGAAGAAAWWAMKRFG